MVGSSAPRRSLPRRRLRSLLAKRMARGGREVSPEHIQSVRHDGGSSTAVCGSLGQLRVTGEESAMACERHRVRERGNEVPSGFLPRCEGRQVNHVDGEVKQWRGKHGSGRARVMAALRLERRRRARVWDGVNAASGAPFYGVLCMGNTPN